MISIKNHNFRNTYRSHQTLTSFEGVMHEKAFNNYMSPPKKGTYTPRNLILEST